MARTRSTKAGTSRTRSVKRATNEKQATTKVCTRCGKRRSLDQFYRDSSTKDGFSTWDKACEAAYAKQYRERKKAEGATA